MDGSVWSIGEEKISFVVCDHPKNKSYPPTGMQEDMDYLQPTPWWLPISHKERNKFNLGFLLANLQFSDTGNS